MKANYKIITNTNIFLLLKDIGPHDKFLSITNDAENVVKKVAPVLDDRFLYYIDTNNEISELIVKEGKFSSFRILDEKTQLYIKIML